MRLVRIGLGSINTTVGAFRDNTDRAIDSRPRHGRRRRHHRRLSRAGHWRLPGRRPHPVAGLRRAQWPRARALRPETAALRSVFVIGVSVLHDGLATTARRSWPAAIVRARARRRSCRPTTSSTKAGPSRAACPAPSRRVHGVPFGDLVIPLRLRNDRPRGLRGHLEPDGPTGAAPTPAPSWSATSPPRPSASASCRPVAR